ncbi:MAG: nucleotidyl transferase AbiEii/AbiGii toxin family protein [Candidatus Obscuribacterales bacterium]
MKLSSQKLMEVGAETGFKPDALEKVVRLLDLLNHIFESDYLKTRLVLKGGTALNLFIFDVPRLSVDIDLNYIGAVDVEKMQAERPVVEAELLAICRRCDLSISEIPSDDHAGGKWRLAYQTAFGGTSSLELDLNFMHRVVFQGVSALDSRTLGSYQARQIPVLDTTELAAGKISALLTRRASRDLFDTSRLHAYVNPQDEQFRLIHVLYGAMNPRADWRNVGVENIAGDLKDLKRQLIPVLRVRDLAAKKDDEQMLSNMIDDCKKFVAPLFPLTATEREFIATLRDKGSIAAKLLTDNQDLIEKISKHPGLLRRAAGARQKQ